MIKLLFLLILFSCGKKKESDSYEIELTEISSDKNLSSNGQHSLSLSCQGAGLKICIQLYSKDGSPSCPTGSPVYEEVSKCTTTQSPFGFCRFEDESKESVFWFQTIGTILGWSGTEETNSVTETLKSACERGSGTYLPYSISN